MKTLLKRIETELPTGIYLSSDFDAIEAEFLKLTEKWLTENETTLTADCTTQDLIAFQTVFEIMRRHLK